jgi:hypothetical protein
VSGAVYNGSQELGDIWREAFGKFEVSNPLHAGAFSCSCEEELERGRADADHCPLVRTDVFPGASLAFRLTRCGGCELTPSF